MAESGQELYINVRQGNLIRLDISHAGAAADSAFRLRQRPLQS